MLFWKAKEILEGGGELLKAEPELAGARLRRALVGSFIALLLALLAFTGLLTVLIGTVILLAPPLGWGGALLAVGATVIGMTALGWAVYAFSSNGAAHQAATGSIAEAPVPPEAEAAQAKERMAQAVHEQKPEKPESESDPISGIKDEAIDLAMRNPEIIGGVALLALSVVGPGRSLRMISRGVATASLVRSAVEAFSADADDKDNQPPEKPQPTASRQTGGRSTPQTNGVAS